MQRLILTRHARQRLQQRGSRERQVAIVLTYGEEVPAKNGCRFLCLSRKEAALLLRQDVASIRDIDRALRLLVLKDSYDRVVTIIKCDPVRRAVPCWRWC
jgi:hypothetical protein